MFKKKCLQLTIIKPLEGPGVAGVFPFAEAQSEAQNGLVQFLTDFEVAVRQGWTDCGSLFRINCQGQQMLLEKIRKEKQIWECLSHWATVQVFVDQEYPSDIQFLLFDVVHLHRIDDGFI